MNNMPKKSHAMSPASLANLRPAPTAGPPLSADERSVMVRVRASAAAAQWFSALTSAERGELVEQLYAERE